MAALPHLPAEVATLIFKELRPRDWLSLRQTCKEINARTAHLFTKRFFKTRLVMFERRSLQYLESIADHPTLSQSVEELEICVSHLLPLHKVQEIKPPYSKYKNLIKNLKRKTLPVECGVDYDEWYDRCGISDDEEDANDDKRGIGDDETEGLPRDRLSRLNATEYRKRLHDQEEVIQTRYDVECLTRAMTHFKSCIQAWGLNRLRRSIGLSATSSSSHVIPFHTNRGE